MQASTPPDRQLRELLFLQRLSVTAASTMERDDLLQLVIRETTLAMEADVCSLYLYDREQDGLVLTATNGLQQEAVGRFLMRVGEGVTGTVAAERRALVVPEVSREPRFKWIEGVDEERFTSMLSVPIEAGPRIVGVLNVQSSARRDFRQDEVAFLSAIAGAIAGVLERSELQRQLEGQLEEIRRSQTVHERFTQLVLQGAGLDNILDAIASLAQGPVGLYDPAGFRFEHGAGGGLPARRIPIPAALSSASTPIEQRGPRGRSPMTLTPVRAGAELAAVLALEGSLAQASPGRRRALEHGATVIALELLKERAAAEVERRLRGDLLEGLLADQRDPAEIRRLAIAAERLGYRIPEQAWVVVLEPDDERAALAMQGHPLQDRFQRDLERLCALVAPGSMLVVRATSLVLLVPTAPPGETGSTRNLEAMEELGRRIQALAGGLEKTLSLSVGIGGRTSSPQGLHRAHEEAREALRLIHRAKQRAAVTSYRSLGAFRLLLEVRDPEVLRRFVEESLGPLLGYQESHRTPLLPTLEGLASHGWNQSATARSLRIHINTLAYRVQRIEALLGMALDDPEARVVIGVALRARSLLPD